MLIDRRQMSTVNLAFNTPKTGLNIIEYTFSTAAGNQAGAKVMQLKVWDFL